MKRVKLRQSVLNKVQMLFEERFENVYFELANRQEKFSDGIQYAYHSNLTDTK